MSKGGEGGTGANVFACVRLFSVFGCFMRFLYKCHAICEFFSFLSGLSTCLSLAPWVAPAFRILSSMVFPVVLSFQRPSAVILVGLSFGVIYVCSFELRW